ncbi:MAG TPA: hypothetical protein VF519_15210 [Mycobacteriales bacterium]|jgi:hypothetical protein
MRGRRGAVPAAAAVAAAVLPACGEPRTAAEYAHLRAVHLGAGAVAGLLVTGAVLARWAYRGRAGGGRPERLALGPPSNTAVVAAYASLAAVAVLGATGGALVASLALPDDPALAAARPELVPYGGAGPAHPILLLALLLVALPVLAALGSVFAHFAAYPPRGAGAPVAAVLHAALAFVLLTGGSGTPHGRELALRWLAAAPLVAGAAAYLALHAGWWRSAAATPRRRS